MKTCMRTVTSVLLTGVLSTGVLLTAGVLTLAGVAYGVEPVNVTVVRWPYT